MEGSDGPGGYKSAWVWFRFERPLIRNTKFAPPFVGNKPKSWLVMAFPKSSMKYMSETDTTMVFTPSCAPRFEFSQKPIGLFENQSTRQPQPAVEGNFPWIQTSMAHAPRLKQRTRRVVRARQEWWDDVFAKAQADEHLWDRIWSAMASSQVEVKLKYRS